MTVSRRIGWRLALLVTTIVVALVAASGANADGAFTFRQILHGTVSFPVDNPCTGETFVADSQFQFVLNVVQTPTGNSLSTDHGVFAGSGVTATGVRYVFGSAGFEGGGVFLAGPDRQVQIGSNATIHFIRTGPDGTTDDFFFQAFFIDYIDLETLTVVREVVRTSTECR
jgi:hypothetical protein